MKVILLAALFAIGLASLVPAESPRAAAAKTSPPASTAATLGFIETNNRSIEIKAGGAGSYTVRSKDGKVLAENLNASQLQAKFPQLYQLTRKGYARNTDARLELHATAPRVFMHAGE